MIKTPQQLSDEARQEIPEVLVHDVSIDVKSGTLPYILIDVRESEEHAKGVIPGAIAIARGVLEMHIVKVATDENKPIVCYCGGGTRSLFAAQQLKKMGYKNVKSMAGGFRAWTQAGNPVQ